MLIAAKTKEDKKAQMPFNWIFAIIVGAVIIFLALFFVTRYANIERYRYDTEMAEKLAILLNPLETSITSSTATLIQMPVDTRISLKCKYEGIGREELRVSTKSSVATEWQEFGAAQSIHNKYIFSRDTEEGRTLYIFSKQFKMPFDVADVIYATTGSYCFVSPPQTIMDEIRDLNASNMHLAYRKQECKPKSISVCFGNSGCDINVYGLCYGLGCNDLYDYGYVQRGNEKSYFNGDALMYGAIFSKEDLYNCNVKRLLNRISLLSRLYIEKTRLLNARGCMTGNLDDRLSDLSYDALSLISSANVMQLGDKAKEVENANNELICKAF
jgi:hypothetical protein